MQLTRGLRIGRPFGIPLLVHWSWLPAAVLLVSHFVLSVYAEQVVGTAVGYGVVTTMLFFACLVAHELGHALLARSMRLGVRGITLFVFGGVARIMKEPFRPAQEVVIALAGPVVSGVLAGVFLSAAARVGGVTGDMLWTLGAANAALALFNLLPGYPLDGGRVLHAVLWKAVGDPHRATLVAGRVGQAIGIVLVGGGIVLFVLVMSDPVADGAAQGLWLAVIGAFLHVLATAARRAANLARRFADEEAGAWARPFGGTLRADGVLATVAPGSAPYAVSDGGRLAGVLVAPGGPSTAIRDAMIPWSPQITFPATQSLARALERLACGPSEVLVVVDEDGSALGVLDRAGVRARLRGDS